MILFYVSGHGLGHMSRQSEVMNAVRRLAPNVPLGLKTPAAQWFVKENMPAGTTCRSVRLDIGVVQADSLNLNQLQTLKAYRELIREKENIMEEEIAWAKSHGVGLIVADIPPLAFDIGERLDIPSICITNFSWDWIYAPYVEANPEYSDVIEEIRNSEGKCSLLLELPFKGDFSAFPQRKDIPLIGRKSILEKEEIRNRMNIRTGQRILLLTFGGFGIKNSAEWETDLDDNTEIITTIPDLMGKGWRYFPSKRMLELGLKYQDVVKAADAVLTKPGYGIVVECIANHTPIIHVERGVFPEYNILVNDMGRFIPEIFMNRDDFYTGRWRKYFDTILQDNAPRQEISIEGAKKAAEIILRFYRERNF